MQLPRPAQLLSPFSLLPAPSDDAGPLVLDVTCEPVAPAQPATWEASKGIVVDTDGDKALDKLRQFGHVDEFRLSHDTLLEIVNSDRVLHAALVTVGPARYNDPSCYPTDGDVNDLRSSVRLSAPDGSNDVTTDVLYLKVEDHDGERAVALVDAILTQAQQRAQEIRSEKARNLVNELNEKANIASADLKEAGDALGTLEKTVGSDLAELRAMHTSPQQESPLHEKAKSVDEQLEAVRHKTTEFAQLREVLGHVQHDPYQLVSTPTGLLASQQTLHQLKEGLIDAQAKRRAAQQAEQDIVDNIRAELEIAVRGIDLEQTVSHRDVASLEAQRGELQDRLERLASVLSEYTALVNRVEQHEELVEEARRQLTNARAILAGANETQLIRPLERKKSAAATIGQSRAFVVLSGLIGGVIVGWGVQLMSASAIPTPSAKYEIHQATPVGTTATVTPAVFVQQDGPHDQI